MIFRAIRGYQYQVYFRLVVLTRSFNRTVTSRFTRDVSDTKQSNRFHLQKELHAEF